MPVPELWLMLELLLVLMVGLVLEPPQPPCAIPARPRGAARAGAATSLPMHWANPTGNAPHAPQGWAQVSCAPRDGG